MKGRYAVRAVCELAQADDGRPVNLADIADRQGISLSYLEQLFAGLRRADVVRSVRGPGGGYLPARPFDQITVSSIFEAVDAMPDVSDPAPGDDTCITQDLWEQLGNQIRWFLNRVTVADILEGRVPGAAGLAAPRRMQPLAAD